MKINSRTCTVIRDIRVGHVSQNSSVHVARVIGLQTDAVVVTETRFTSKSMSILRHSFGMCHLNNAGIVRRL